VATTASHAPSLHLPCEPVELEGLQLVELLVQDPTAAPSVSVGFCEAGGVELVVELVVGLVVGLYRGGPEAFYGQIRHRHLLLLQRGRPLMQDYSQLMAHPTGTLESIAVRTAVNTLTSPERHGSAPRHEYCPGKRTVSLTAGPYR